MSLNADRDPTPLSPTRRALLDAWIHAGAQAMPPTIPPRGSAEPVPLSFAQERLWFLNQFAPGVPVNHLGFAVRLQGPILIESLEYVLTELFRRHEAMRTTFPLVDGRPVQQVSPFMPVRLPVIDVQADSEPARKAEIDRLTAILMREPFDLVNGPVWRLTVLRFDEMDLVLVITFHHIVADARSVTLLKRELPTDRASRNSERNARIRAVGEQGVAWAKIAAVFGLSPSAVRCICRDLPPRRDGGRAPSR